MDAADIKSFTARITNFYDLTNKEKIVYAAYYLTSMGQGTFSSGDIEVFFDKLAIAVSRIPQILSEESKIRGGKGKFLKAKGQGYYLNGSICADIARVVEKIPELKQFDDDLAELINKVTDSSEQAMLDEAMRCYQVGSNRAMIILMWIAALYHIENYTLSNHKVDFNKALGNHPDKRVSKFVVRKIDDFTNLKESDLITLLGSAGVISKSVKRMLESRLGERNTAAHPSSVSVSGPQALAFGHDMVANVILKHK